MPGLFQKIVNTITPASTETYSREMPIKKSPLFVPAGNVAMAMKSPVSGSEAPIATTSSGVAVRNVPEDWKPHIQEAYSRYPALGKKYKGLLEAILMQESSMGTIDTNYNPKIGESAWLAGATDMLKKELEGKGIKYDLNTQRGLINAMAAFLDVKKTVLNPGSTIPKEYNDPVNLYLQRYKTVAGKTLTPDQVERFREYINYYKNQT